MQQLASLIKNEEFRSLAGHLLEMAIGTRHSQICASSTDLKSLLAKEPLAIEIAFTSESLCSNHCALLQQPCQYFCSHLCRYSRTCLCSRLRCYSWRQPLCVSMRLRWDCSRCLLVSPHRILPVAVLVAHVC